MKAWTRLQNTSAVTMLARIEAMCGPLPADMLAAGHHSHLYYTRSRQLYERDAQTGAIFLLEPNSLPLSQVRNTVIFFILSALSCSMGTLRLQTRSKRM